MKHVVIGTAGHVDHGKTLLVKALTGIETDRLKEEKKRGITIELGFAYLDFENGERAGIVDVPGHEKFIRHMLAGAGGIDLAMLVVAADEGFMPQTIEHLGILSLLNIQTGLVVITKCDMVEPEWVDMVREDIAAHVKGTFLEGAPVLAVSAYTGQGIDELKALLQDMVTRAGTKNLHIPFRIPVDRVFSVDGFGTVITGTLIEGQVSVGDGVTVYPAGTEGRIRNLQVHGDDVERAYAGQRVAVNISGIHKSDMDRGDVLARPGSLTQSLMLDVRLSVLPESNRTITSGMQLHLFHEARTLLCKAVLLDREALQPGESCYAQLRLTEPMSAKSGDRFVVRFYSPLETIGGGTILDECPPRHKRNDAAVLKALSVRETGSQSDRLLQAVEEAFAAHRPWTEVARGLSGDSETILRERDALLSCGKLLPYGSGCFLTPRLLQSLGEKAEGILRPYHQKNPLQAGIRREELVQKLFGKLELSAAGDLLTLLEQEGVLTFPSAQRVALRGFEVRFSPQHKALLQRLEAIFAAGGFSPPSLDEVYQQFTPREKEDVRKVLDAMFSNEQLVLLSPQIAYSAEAYRQAWDAMMAHFAAEPTLTLAQLRDRLSTSRKYALALLEYWDRCRVTRKDGDLRTLFPGAAGQAPR